MCLMNFPYVPDEFSLFANEFSLGICSWLGEIYSLFPALAADLYGASASAGHDVSA